MTNEEYYSLVVPYEDAMKIMRARLDMIEHLLADNYSDKMIHDIQQRIKKKPSIEKKLRKMNLQETPMDVKENLRDIAGMRVICYFVKDIDILVDLLRRQVGLIWLKEKDYIRHPKTNGYKSFHVIIGVPITHMERGTAQTEYYPVEVQIRTIGMDFWASMEHRITYKQDYEWKDQLQSEFLKYAENIDGVEKAFERYLDNEEYDFKI